MQACLCTISNNFVFSGTETLIKSFLKNNQWFSNDILILYSNTISPLSDENKEKLITLYEKVKLIEINEQPYTKISNYLKRVKFNNDQSGYYDLFKYEIFSIKGYDRLVYLDKDSLVLNDISEAFNQQHDFVVTQETKNYPTQGYRYFQNSKPFSVLFNSGFFSIAGSMFNSQITTRLQNYSLTKPDWEQFEQTIMNEYFKNNDILFLHNKFNTLKVCFQDNDFRKFDPEIKIIRFIGEKPWQRKTKQSEMVYQNLEKIWFDFNNIDIKSFNTPLKPYIKVIDVPRPLPDSIEPIVGTKKIEAMFESPISKIVEREKHKDHMTNNSNNPNNQEPKHVPRPIRPARPIKVNPRRTQTSYSNIDLSSIGLNLVNLKWLTDLINNKRVCLVANSSDLLEANLGSFIDGHDIVIRCNSYVINKEFTGEKTDIHVMYYLHNDNLEKNVDTRIIYSPNLINWKNFLKYKLIKGNQNNVVDLYWPMQNGFLNKDEHLFPTTGFNTLRTICALGGYSEFNLIAFNFYEKGNESIYRIGNNQEISKTHNFQYEKKWILNNAKKYEKYIISL